MRVETRKDKDGHWGLLVIAESKQDSEILDKMFGVEVGNDGLIATTTAEVRLSDDLSTHYVLAKARCHKTTPLSRL